MERAAQASDVLLARGQARTRSHQTWNVLTTTVVAFGSSPGELGEQTVSAKGTASNADTVFRAQDRCYLAMVMALPLKLPTAIRSSMSFQVLQIVTPGIHSSMCCSIEADPGRLVWQSLAHRCAPGSTTRNGVNHRRILSKHAESLVSRSWTRTLTSNPRGCRRPHSSSAGWPKLYWDGPV